MSFKTVHMSLLTFVCTVPCWLEERLVQSVKAISGHLKSRGVVEVLIDKKMIMNELNVSSSLRMIVFIILIIVSGSHSCNMW